MSLSRQQHDILVFIESCLDQQGRPPTQLEICTAFGFKQNATASYHLRALEAAGHIERAAGKSRGIRLLKPGRRSATPAETQRLPILGRVAAGLPIGAAVDLDSDEARWLDLNCFSPRPDYLLRVVGESMRDEGILDGDLVAVKRALDAGSGEIVVARIDGEITIKRLQRLPDRLRLLPRHPDFAPIDVPPDADFAIEGIYCGLLRPGA